MKRFNASIAAEVDLSSGGDLSEGRLAEKLGKFSRRWIGSAIPQCIETLGKQLDDAKLVGGGKTQQLFFEFSNSHDRVDLNNRDNFILRDVDSNYQLSTILCFLSQFSKGLKIGN